MPMFHVKHGGATRRILSISGMVSRETSKLIQRPQTWLVSVSREDQDSWHVFSDLPPVGVDGFSQRLNKLHQSSQQLVGEGSHTPKPSPTHHVSRETSTNSWSNEAHSVVGKCGSASQGINTHNHFLGVRKSRLDDTFFLTPTIGFPNAEWTSKTRCFTWNLEAYSAARKIHPHQQVENQREHTI